jgi:hypothetical protein
MVEGSASLERQVPTSGQEKQEVRQEMLSWLAAMPNREKLPETVKKAQAAVLQNLPVNFERDSAVLLIKMFYFRDDNILGNGRFFGNAFF